LDFGFAPDPESLRRPAVAKARALVYALSCDCSAEVVDRAALDKLEGHVLSSTTKAAIRSAGR
jgi:hypothetical protein